MSEKHKHSGQGEDEDKDLKAYYAYEEKKTYAFQDQISEEDIQRRKLSKDREKQWEDYKRDKDFYYKVGRKRTDEELVQRDAERNFEQDKKLRKTSKEIVRETELRESENM